MDFDDIKNKARDAVSGTTGDSETASDHADEHGAANQTDYQNRLEGPHRNNYQTKTNDLDQTDYQNQPDGLDQRGP